MRIVLAAALVLAACAVMKQEPVAVRSATASAVPRFAVDRYWPKALPGNWILGQVAGIAVDRHDHVWIIHRPGTLLDDEKGAQGGGTGGSNSTTQLGRPAHMMIDAAANELYVADGANGDVVAISRDDGSVVTRFGRTGRMAGEFKWVHNIAIDSKGNLYTSEVGYGRRVQKFTRVE